MFRVIVVEDAVWTGFLFVVVVLICLFWGWVYFYISLGGFESFGFFCDFNNFGFGKDVVF